jgi:hypothetical protein
VDDRNETVAKPPKRRFRRRATPAKRGIGPGCWPTEVGGPAGRLRAAGRAHGVQMALNGIQRVWIPFRAIWTPCAPYSEYVAADERASCQGHFS